MSEKPLIDWLEKRKESSIVKKIRDHVSKVLDTAVDVDKVFAFILSSKRAEVIQALRRVEMDEKAADNIQVSIFEELSRGDLEPKEREDLMHLIRRIDDVSDWFKVAGKNVELLLETDEPVPETLWASFKEMMKNSVDCCKSLKVTAEALGRSKEDVIKARLDVDRYELRVDELYFGVKKMMLKDVKDSRTFVVLNDLLVGIENATDSCKAAADTIYILAMARYLGR